MGVRPTLNMRAGLTFVRERFVYRIKWCSTLPKGLKSEDGMSTLKVVFLKRASKET